ncbi:MAG: PD40 domain-containing protein [Anaerolineae bacterium]|nr:PD40 domain-containing protein [Anaerolineae bacterium]
MNARFSERGWRLDRLDSAVLIVIVVLLLALGLTVARGSQIGLMITAYAPRDSGSIHPHIQISFDDPVDLTSVQAALSIDPPVLGSFTASGDSRTVSFIPSETLTVGQSYTVHLKAGVVSTQTERSLKDDQVWSFRIRQPRVTYLGTDPNNQLVQNIFLADPDAPDSAQQLTFSTTGVIEYDPSPDGSKIAYSEFQQTGNNNLFVWDASTGKSTLLFDCTNAVCNNPVWSPDGKQIAFERSEISANGTGLGVSRVWLLEVGSGNVRPLLQDSQQIGYAPEWSPDGSKVALFSVSAGGIVVHDMATDTDRVINSAYGEVGVFSPDGKWLAFPQMVEVQEKAYAAHFVLVDMNSDFLTQSDIIPTDDPSNDVEGTWLNARTLIVARQAPFQSSTGGIRPGPQLYRLDVDTGQATPLFDEPNYTNGNIAVSPLQDKVAFQRFELGRQGARTEIWTLDLATGKLIQLANNALLPKWIP